MPKKLTELLREAVAKNQTEEGRRELREQPERMEAEEVQTAQKAAQASPALPDPGSGRGRPDGSWRPSGRRGTV